MDVLIIVVSIVVLIVTFIVKLRLISKLLDFICSTSAYKKYFANLIIEWQKNGKNPTSPLFIPRKKFYQEISAKVEELSGDILEIGAGSGNSLEWLQLPEGCSLVAIDMNPYFEETFMECLSKCPDIKLKDYLVQSADDMSNIPDNTFSVVFVQDVLCSFEEDSLRKMLKEVKRVLKPGGCFFFLEHVLDKPGTWRRFAQKLISGWTGLWPRLLSNCHCDRETWCFIQEAGFTSVTISDFYIFYPPKPNLVLKLMIFFTRRFISGHAKK